MEKRSKSTLFMLPRGDKDDGVDWEDFVIVQGEEIMTSFNQRKMRTQFYLSKRGGTIKKIDLDKSKDIGYDQAALLVTPINQQTFSFPSSESSLSSQANQDPKVGSPSDNSSNSIKSPSKRIRWSWKGDSSRKTSINSNHGHRQISSNQREADEEEEQQKILDEQTLHQKKNQLTDIEEVKQEETINDINLYASNRRRNTIDEEPNDRYTQPEDGGDDEEVYSRTKLITPYSYMNEALLRNNIVGDAPPPTYEPYSSVKVKHSCKKDDILHGLLVQEKGGLKCNNQKILDKQKGIVKDVISQAASNIFSGQSIIGISLPVRIFEPRSLLQRICDWYGFGPIFLKKAALLDDKVERFKLTIAYAMSSLYCAVKQQKPFNPLLGETYQSFFEDGTKIYCEHTSHHPPIANFLMEDPDQLYSFWGHYEFKAKISKNTLVMRNEGPNHVKYKDGQTITYCYPTNKLGGMMWGERTLNIDGNMVFEDKENGLKAVVIFQHQKYDRFIGKIYKYNHALNLQKKEPNKLSEIKDIQSEICGISGSWLNHLYIDDKEYWNIETMFPLKPIGIPNPLNSDPRYREDLIWLKREHEDYAQIWKTRLEIQQRHERKLRLECDKKRKHAK